MIKLWTNFRKNADILQQDPQEYHVSFSFIGFSSHTCIFLFNDFFCLCLIEPAVSFNLTLNSKVLKSWKNLHLSSCHVLSLFEGVHYGLCDAQKCTISVICQKRAFVLFLVNDLNCQSRRLLSKRKLISRLASMNHNVVRNGLSSEQEICTVIDQKINAISIETIVRIHTLFI